MKTILLPLLFTAAAFASHDGAIQGSPTFPAGKFNQCIDGMTASNYITLPSGTFTFTSGQPWTIEMWMKTPGSSYSVALAFGSSTSSMVIVGENSDVALSTLPSGAGVTGTTNLNTSLNWHHVAVTYNGTNAMAIYVDGNLEASATPAFSATDASSGQIGRNDGGGHYWQGQLDEIAIWSTVKYSSNFTPPVAPYTGMEANLVALYHLDGNAVDSTNGGPGPAAVYGGVF